MNPLHYLSATLLSLLLGGCVSFHPAGPISDPAQTAQISQPRAAMLADTQVTDSDMDAALQKQLAQQFTQQLQRRIEKGAYFEDVIRFPATLGEDDVLLTFNFTQLQGKRTPHPAYFPGALLTLTVWIWANGPIYVDRYNLAGELSIEDRYGQRLASSRQKVVVERNTGLWDEDYMSLSLGAAQLNQLVEQLLQDGTAQLDRSNSHLSRN